MKSTLGRSITLDSSSVLLILYTLFFCSGISALIYQFMWQRMLFIVFGVDLTSITIIVSVFMLGLGIGGICGGYLADKFPKRLLYLYTGIEFFIALFGFASPDLIDGLGNELFANSPYITAYASFLLLALPTLLMGATFPLLVKHVNTHYKNIGRSVGNLYFFNTLGGALGAYLSGFVLLYSLDVAESVYYAALLNIAIATTAFLFFRKE